MTAPTNNEGIKTRIRQLESLISQIRPLLGEDVELITKYKLLNELKVLKYAIRKDVDNDRMC